MRCEVINHRGVSTGRSKLVTRSTHRLLQKPPYWHYLIALPNDRTPGARGDFSLSVETLTIAIPIATDIQHI